MHPVCTVLYFFSQATLHNGTILLVPPRSLTQLQIISAFAFPYHLPFNAVEPSLCPCYTNLATLIRGK